MSLSIRSATKADSELVFTFIRDLAEYEKLLDDVVATPADIERALFAEHPRVFCDIAEWESQAAGFALWFYNFSTFRGRHGIYLEDLFVRPAFRGKGIGKALLANLAKRAVREGCARVEWWVLDWNEPSIKFYESLGAIAMEEWTVFRLTGDALERLSQNVKEPVIALIVAVAENGVIGREGKLPWRIPEDMKWFKARTEGRPLVMGRKTWESLPKRPLPGRTNIVITRDRNYMAERAVVVGSLAAAIHVATGEEPEEIMVIGGGEIYRAALPRARRIYLTSVHGAIAGDATFPDIDREEWSETIVGVYPSSATRPIGYSFFILDRKEVRHVRP